MSRSIDYAFVHGGGQGGWVWDQTIAALSRQTEGSFGRALALDVPGCGAKQGRKTADLTLEDVAAELIGDIEAARMNEVVLVGHSQGGQAIAFMLRMKPGLFRRVIYVSCSIPLPGQTVLQMMGSGAQGSSAEEIGWPAELTVDGVRLRSALAFSQDMNPDQASVFQQKFGPDQWPAKTYAETRWSYEHLVAVPATYVLCLRDRMLPAPWQEKFAARFGAKRVIRIDTGHQAMNTRPHALAEILLQEGVFRAP